MSETFLWGRSVRLPALDEAGAKRLCAQAEGLRKRAAARPTWQTLDILHRAGRLWADSSWRRQAQRLMPGVSGFSPAMVRRTLDILPELLDRGALKRRLAAELGRGDALETWSLEPESDFSVKALPLGSVLHVAAGNIFLGCVDSVIMSLLTNNVTILRLSGADRRFPLLFARSLAAADPGGELASTLAVVHWPSGEEKVERVFKRKVQGIAVWGGAQALAAYRDGLGSGCRLMAFGPKLSFGVITRAGLAQHGAAEAARRAARDISLWDQAACASPQTLFVQGGRCEDFLRALAGALRRGARELPPGRPGPEQAAELVEHRHLALAQELQGRGRLLASAQAAGWTVAWRAKGGLTASPLGRFIQVRPYKDIADLLGKIRAAVPYLQSAGILAATREASAYTQALAAAGLARLPELGRMLESETGQPHDGRYPLRELVRLSTAPGESVAADNGALRGLLAQAATQSSFYRARLRGWRGDTSRVPLLDKEDLYLHGPPRSESMLTRAGDGEGRVVFASGGSTGKPKFSLYTQDEFERTGRWLAWGLRRAGLEPGDVLANLFVAGNLWSSFLAVSGAARALPVTHLPIGGASEPAFVLDCLRRFKANVLIGLPSTLLELARHAERSGAKGLIVRKVFYGGEHLSAGAALRLKRALGVRLVRSAGYASVDAGLIGFQCARCEGGVHHAAQGLQRLEIVGGEIVATNLLRRWMPVLRYRTGDRGRWVAGPCPCGHAAPRFELLGRCDDRVNAGGAHLDVGDIGRAVASVRGLGPVYQVEVRREGGADRLRVKVERARGGGSISAARLQEELLKSSAELKDSVLRGWLKLPDVEVLSPGGLPRQSRTGKVRRVVDLRRLK